MSRLMRARVYGACSAALAVLLVVCAPCGGFAQAGGQAQSPDPKPGSAPFGPPTVPVITPPVITPPVVSPPAVPTITPSPTDPKRASPKAEGTGAKASGAQAKAAGDSASLLSLLGLGSDSALLQALNPGQSRDDEMSSLLEKALKRIETERSSGDSSAGSAKANGAAPASPASRAQSPSEPSILRFLVNGYDILPTVSGPLIASRSGEGSFLITGDRFLVLEGRRRRETFYLLYRRDTETRGRLFIDVSQEVVNVESFLYRLSRRGPFKAELIGDLLVVRDPARGLTLDLVFRTADKTE